MTQDTRGYNSQKTIPAHLVAFAIERIESHRKHSETMCGDYGNGRAAGLKLAADVVRSVFDVIQRKGD